MTFWRSRSPSTKRLFPRPGVPPEGRLSHPCTGCVKDADGNVTEVLCEYDPASRGGDPADGRKVKGHHPLGGRRNQAVDAEVRLYRNLFTDARSRRGGQGLS